MIIGEAKEDDSKGVVQMFQVLDAETNFLMYEPGERDSSIDVQAKNLIRFHQSPRHIFLIATDDIGVRGFCAGKGGHQKRNYHCLLVIIGITQAFTGKGLGRRLMIDIENWAIKRDFRRLELTVMTHNERAIALYTSIGYVKEGTLQNSLLVDGELINQFTMAKLI